MKVVIFDIDGTLADCTHRLHHINSHPKNWDAFFADCAEDALIEPIADLMRCVAAGHEYQIVLVSGRPEKCRADTVSWMIRHGLDRCYGELYMRADGDFRADNIVKSQILDSILQGGHEVAFVVDDRPRVVAMWRERGLMCLHCSSWTEEKGEYIYGLLTLMVGPSGAGKSTWLAEQGPAVGIKHSHIISSDKLRQELCGDFRSQDKNEQVFSALHAITKERLRHGLPVVIDATNIRRKDRLACVALASGNPVVYIVVDRPLQEKRKTGGWRNELNGFDLIGKHDQTFQSQIKEILSGDSLPNVTVLDMRKV